MLRGAQQHLWDAAMVEAEEALAVRGEENPPLARVGDVAQQIVDELVPLFDQVTADLRVPCLTDWLHDRRLDEGAERSMSR